MEIGASLAQLEIFANDPQASASFYASAFGLKPSNMDGTSFPDAVIQANGSVDLRKDRGVGATNPGNGRVYRIHFTASGPGGQSCQGDVNVFAPKTLATPVVQDPIVWDATIKQP
jgi:hypothetical protein